MDGQKSFAPTTQGREKTRPIVNRTSELEVDEAEVVVEAVEARAREAVEAEITTTTMAVDSGAREVASEDHHAQAHHTQPVQGLSHHSPHQK